MMYKIFATVMAHGTTDTRQCCWIASGVAFHAVASSYDLEEGDFFYGGFRVVQNMVDSPTTSN